MAMGDEVNEGKRIKLGEEYDGDEEEFRRGRGSFSGAGDNESVGNGEGDTDNSNTDTDNENETRAGGGTRRKISSGGGDGQGDASTSVSTRVPNPNPIPGKLENQTLYVIVQNAIYPVTTDILHKITTPFGAVQRIVIMRNAIGGAVRAMVEFDCIESAKKALAELQGRDIYTGCCTLRLDYAIQKHAKLSVARNNIEESWDYTLPPNGDKDAAILAIERTPGLLEVPRGVDGEEDQGMEMINSRRTEETPVIMVYGLRKDKITPDNLFNIFCLYGNVMKVKLLRNKEGCAFIEMDDVYSVDRAISNFNRTPMFDSMVTLGRSKHQFIRDPGPPTDGVDDSQSFKDFSRSRYHRFSESGRKFHILPPSRFLFFFGAPPTVQEKDLLDAVQNCGAPNPEVIQVFRHERSCSGRMTFETIPAAVEALALVNHHVVITPDGNRYFTVKLNFSPMVFK